MIVHIAMSFPEKWNQIKKNKLSENYLSAEYARESVKQIDWIKKGACRETPFLFATCFALSPVCACFPECR